MSLGHLCYRHEKTSVNNIFGSKWTVVRRGHGADTGFFVYILHNCEAHAYHVLRTAQADIRVNFLPDTGSPALDKYFKMVRCNTYLIIHLTILKKEFKNTSTQHKSSCKRGMKQMCYTRVTCVGEDLKIKLQYIYVNTLTVRHCTIEIRPVQGGKLTYTFPNR